MGKLTAIGVKKQNVPGRYGDGDGLWLQVQGPTQKSWLLRYSFGGKAREMGLGPVAHVGLAEAREQARAQRALLRQGIDPLAAKRGTSTGAANKPPGLTFRKAAEDLIASKRPGWRNDKHASQWSSTLATYVWIVVCAALPVAACAGEPGHATRNVGTDGRGVPPRWYFPFDPPLPPNLWLVEPPPRPRRTSAPRRPERSPRPAAGRGDRADMRAAPADIAKLQGDMVAAPTGRPEGAAPGRRLSSSPLGRTGHHRPIGVAQPCPHPPPAAAQPPRTSIRRGRAAAVLGSVRVSTPSSRRASMRSRSSRSGSAKERVQCPTLYLV
jgi:hypothetical protein